MTKTWLPDGMVPRRRTSPPDSSDFKQIFYVPFSWKSFHRKGQPSISLVGFFQHRSVICSANMPVKMGTTFGNVLSATLLYPSRDTNPRVSSRWCVRGMARTRFKRDSESIATISTLGFPGTSAFRNRLRPLSITIACTSLYTDDFDSSPSDFSSHVTNMNSTDLGTTSESFMGWHVRSTLSTHTQHTHTHI